MLIPPAVVTSTATDHDTGAAASNAPLAIVDPAAIPIMLNTSGVLGAVPTLSVLPTMLPRVLHPVVMGSPQPHRGNARALSDALQHPAGPGLLHRLDPLAEERLQRAVEMFDAASLISGKLGSTYVAVCVCGGWGVARGLFGGWFNPCCSLRLVCHVWACEGGSDEAIEAMLPLAHARLLLGDVRVKLA